MGLAYLCNIFRLLFHLGKMQEFEVSSKFEVLTNGDRFRRAVMNAAAPA
jgi:hypothetical protein